MVHTFEDYRSHMVKKHVAAQLAVLLIEDYENLLA